MAFVTPYLNSGETVISKIVFAVQQLLGRWTNAPVTVTASYTMLPSDTSVICNGAATITLTLLSAGAVPGRILYVQNYAAQLVNSASSNVAPLGSATAGTAILAATIGKWAILQSDGTNWIILAAN